MKPDHNTLEPDASHSVSFAVQKPPTPLVVWLLATAVVVVGAGAVKRTVDRYR